MAALRTMKAAKAQGISAPEEAVARLFAPRYIKSKIVF